MRLAGLGVTEKDRQGRVGEGDRVLVVDVSGNPSWDACSGSSSSPWPWSPLRPRPFLLEPKLGILGYKTANPPPGDGWHLEAKAGGLLEPNSFRQDWLTKTQNSNQSRIIGDWERE